MKSLESPAELRTVDVARLSGYSVQQVRNLEEVNVLPPARRTDSGYRRYTHRHVRAALAYRALAAAVGPVEAKSFTQAMHERPGAWVAELFDRAHARLDQERAELDETAAAVERISLEPMLGVTAADRMSISELAEAIGVRASTLRHWDSEGLVIPERAVRQGVRQYGPEQVRDARIVCQLRAAGYRVPAVRDLITRLRTEPDVDDLAAALSDRRATLATRSMALLEAASEYVALQAISDDG